VNPPRGKQQERSDNHKRAPTSAQSAGLVAARGALLTALAQFLGDLGARISVRRVPGPK